MDPWNWYLEHFHRESGEAQRIAVRPLPFAVGRHAGSDLLLDSQHGSQRHAEFFLRGRHLWLRDLDSTNGTAVNGDRLLGERQVQHGDIVHFADLEFRMLSEQPPTSLMKTQAFSRTQQQRLAVIARTPVAFREMLANERIWTDFQPLVRLTDKSLFGYELLGRGQLDQQTTYPGDLFFIAEKLGHAVELSVAFRAAGLDLAQQLDGDPTLFVNTHPQELREIDALLSSLVDLRAAHPQAKIVLEIHEAAVADVSVMTALRGGLEELRIPIAFDDFGTGQARLLELAEVEPQYLKFDAVLIEGLHAASKKRRNMVEALIRLSRDLEIIPVAECIETADEARICTDLGFELAQGYFFGRPSPVENHL